MIETGRVQSPEITTNQSGTVTTIKLPFLDTVKRKVISVKECYLILYSTYLVYKIVSIYESDDNEKGLWEEYNCNFRWTKLKKNIDEVNMLFNNPENAWTVELAFMHGDGDMWNFKTPQDALKIYEALQNYFLS